MNILVTGASGYIGRLLIPRLVAEGHHVTCVVRNPERLTTKPPEGVEIQRGDLLSLSSLHPAMEGIDVAFYLVHSMADGVSGYITRDHQAAFNFALAAQEAGVQRIIYLGGLGECDKSISPHLEARQHVGDVLRMFCVPVTEFRAAIVIGSGSMSFEMIRYITERLPVIFTPRWINTLCQPIAIDNVLDYLLLALSEPRSVGEIYEIGGPDVLSYAEIMRGYASARRLRRWQVRVPFLSMRMLGTGADIVTPLPAPYLHILIEGLRSEVVVRDLSAQEMFDVKLIPYEMAIQRALERNGSGEVEAYWSGRKSGLKPGKKRTLVEGMYIEQRRMETEAEPEAVFEAMTSMGGKNGWYYGNGLWQLRGLIDRLVGGVGMRRGRPSGDHLQAGDVVDGYRVEQVEPGHVLRLRNEMKAPGPAWMQFEVQSGENGKTLFVQTAFFEPHGVTGLIYWYALYPFHQLIFEGLARAIVKRAEAACKGEVVIAVSK